MIEEGYATTVFSSIAGTALGSIGVIVFKIQSFKTHEHYSTLWLVVTTALPIVCAGIGLVKGSDSGNSCNYCCCLGTTTALFAPTTLVSVVLSTEPLLLDTMFPSAILPLSGIAIPLVCSISISVLSSVMYCYYNPQEVAGNMYQKLSPLIAFTTAVSSISTSRLINEFIAINETSHEVEAVTTTIPGIALSNVIGGLLFACSLCPAGNFISYLFPQKSLKALHTDDLEERGSMRAFGGEVVGQVVQVLEQQASQRPLSHNILEEQGSQRQLQAPEPGSTNELNLQGSQRQLQATLEQQFPPGEYDV